MKVMQSFLMFFYILDQCYEHCPENDLGGFLGSISPELWEDGKPIDKAVYNDWKARNNITLLNRQNIINAILDFLQYYQSKFGLDFSKTQSILKNTDGIEMIDMAMAKTDLMYQKYNYND
mgnify:CR=1 FL=1